MINNLFIVFCSILLCILKDIYVFLPFQFFTIQQELNKNFSFIYECKRGMITNNRNNYFNATSFSTSISDHDDLLFYFKTHIKCIFTLNSNSCNTHSSQIFFLNYT